MTRYFQHLTNNNNSQQTIFSFVIITILNLSKF